jgi:signal transduction histidine kinase
MKDMRQGTTLFVSEANPDGGMLSNVLDITDAPISSLTYLIKALLASASPTSVMRNDEDFANLWHPIFKIASVSRDPSQFLMKIASALGDAFQVDGCVIALPDAQVACWSCGRIQPIHDLPAIQAVFADAAFPDEPVLVDNLESCRLDDLDAFTRLLLDIWQSKDGDGKSSLPAKAVLGTRIEFQGRINGLISLIRLRPYEWTSAESRGLEMVAQQVAIALAQLQIQQQFDQQMQYQAVINRLTMAIHNATDLHEILQLATEGTANALQAERGLLLQLKYWDPLFKSRFQEHVPKVRALVTCEWFQATSADPSIEPVSALNQSFWISECALCQHALLHPRHPIAVADPSQLPTVENVPGIAPVFLLEEMPSLLLFPLESQGTVLGFLVFQHSQSRIWQPEEIELVELVSAQVGTAIIQTETLRQVQALVEKRTAELQQSLSIQAKLYERTRQQLEQLRHLNQLKDEFLSTVSHELRTPLTSMTMAIRMLRQIGLSSDRSERYLDILEQQCAQETNLINDLLALQELESKQVSIQLEEINLTDLILELEQGFNLKWAAKGLNLVLDLPSRPLKLHSDRDSLNRILTELLTNAGKYSDPNSIVHLKVTCQAQQPANKVILTLTNSGPGISPAELPFIFDKFRRCQGVTQNAIQGTGLGLALVKSLVQMLNGTITVSSCPTETTMPCTTSFTLTLPQSLDLSSS